ncbi:MAG: hypothetical protein ABIJ14_03435 [Nanoarchaeota archaeon]|nr:hypothetical protein [Nanoarchaeota archaeon]
MGLFNFGKSKKGKVIDLSERYRRQQERTERIREDMLQTRTPKPQSQESSESQTQSGVPGGMFSIFGGPVPIVNQKTSSENSMDSPTILEERRRKLTKRLIDMTGKIEELSNQIYHLQQRIEVLEKKAGAGEF